MAAVLTEKLIYEILAVVEEIPEGKVSTYGRIAELIGREKTPGWWGRCSPCPIITADIPATAW